MPGGSATKSRWAEMARPPPEGTAAGRNASRPRRRSNTMASSGVCAKTDTVAGVTHNAACSKPAALADVNAHRRQPLKAAGPRAHWGQPRCKHNADWRRTALGDGHPPRQGNDIGLSHGKVACHSFGEVTQHSEDATSELRKACTRHQRMKVSDLGAPHVDPRQVFRALCVIVGGGEAEVSPLLVFFGSTGYAGMHPGGHPLWSLGNRRRDWRT